jgi:hypothetical protein
MIHIIAILVFTYMHLCYNAKCNPTTLAKILEDNRHNFSKI